MIPLFLTALTIAVAASLRFLKERPLFVRIALLVALAACFAGLIYSCCHSSHWVGASPDLPMFSAGWFPVFSAMALLAFSLNRNAGTPFAGWTPRLLVLCAVLVLTGAVFISRGQVHHPTEIAPVSAILLFSFIAATALLLAGEAGRSSPSNRTGFLVGAASMSALSVLLSFLAGDLNIITFSLSSPPAMLGCILLAVSLFHLLRSSERPLPIATTIVPTWCILWGLALEFA